MNTTIIILILGFLFGAILQYANLNRYNVISGMATLENFAVVKAITVAIGLGAIIIAIEIGLGFATYHIKPFLLGGIALGGIIFGVGMAILGYCPGTLPISLGEGSIDALLGIIGGLIGGFVYTILLSSIQSILGPDLGSISLYTLVGQHQFIFYILDIIIGIAFVWIGFILIVSARMAGGCTSGYILSGGMQLSVSSLVFAVFVFAGLLFTGKYFYK